MDNTRQFGPDSLTERHPICVVPPEQHYDTWKELVADIQFYERRRAYFYNEHPSFKPQMGKYEVVKDDHGKGFVLLPTTLDYGVLYRGQKSYHEKCLPTIYRYNFSKEDLFVEHLRIAEFMLLLDSYEITKRFAQSKYNIDYIGLAQHYGLNTDVLDFTSDVITALFFAMCDYDETTDNYLPKKDNRTYTAYLYAKLTLEPNKNPQDIFGVFSDRIKIIGMQPFKRPGLQKGYSYHADRQGLSDGYLYSFDFTKKDSEDIYNHFHQGKDLWCKDEIADYANMIKKSKTFSSKAVSLATRMFDNTISIGKHTKQLKSNGYVITSISKLPWFNGNHPCNEGQWDVFRKDFVHRNAIVGDKRLDNRTTHMVGEELLFNYIYGSTDCPKDYDSGLAFERFDGHTFSFTQDFAHKPMAPDTRDGKIHPLWKKSTSVAPRDRSFEIPEMFKGRLVKVKK